MMMNGRSNQPRLKLSPTAWAKLLFLTDRGETKVGGLGISCSEDPLKIDEVQLIRQRCTPVSVFFDDAALADWQLEAGPPHGAVGRLLVLTHPGDCPLPSAADEATFARTFGHCDWSALLIVARSGATYARLAFQVGPGGGWEIPVEVDFVEPFAASDRDAWECEYVDHVQREAARSLDCRDELWYEDMAHDVWLDDAWACAREEGLVEEE